MDILFFLSLPVVLGLSSAEVPGATCSGGSMGAKRALTVQSGFLCETCSRTSPAETTGRKGESEGVTDLMESDRLQPRGGDYVPQARIKHTE